MFMVLFVLNDPDQTMAVLDAWEAAGAPGVTILESSGLGRVRRRAMRDDLPLLPTIRALLAGQSEHHHTLFTVVEDEAVVDALIAAAEKVVGDLEQPDRGVLFVLPVLRTVGFSKVSGANRSG